MNVSAIIVTRGEDVVRLWSKIDRRGMDECWPFQGAKNEQGYGLLSINRRSRLAHRLVAEVVDGSIPAGVCVLHRCDNPPCCNPAHLFRGTRTDNNRDAIRKGRAKAPPRNDVSGERNGQCRLSDEAVGEIRLRCAGGERVTYIAREFGVSHSLVSMILSGQRR